jgi:ribonuclease G
MGMEILINVTPHETRVAVLENGVLQDVFIERVHKRGLVGNIYKGRVARVLPGMQAAFVEIGLDRAAFLHASDILLAAKGGEEGKIRTPPEGISELLTEGQEILVQVVKDPLGTKGARLTMQIAIPSRYVVFVPYTQHIGVSHRLEDVAERQRLKDIVNAFVPQEGGGGYILRTAAEGIREEDLRADMDFLHKLWQSVEERARSEPPETLIHEDLPLVLRTLRDLVHAEIEKLRIDSRETCQKVIAFAEKFMPEMVSCIEHYPGERPIFDLYGVEDEIQKALERRVPLKSGGYLIIDQTEAMTTIDVNTGAFVGHRNLEETIFKTNLEATYAITRQLRLRNLGGIIIIDLIDMEDPEHKRQVLRSLEKYLERDHTRTHISGVSALGLVEMTRKRTRESLGHILCEPCPVCRGRGSLKTAETVCYEIFREILREARQYESQKLLVLASQEVVDLMLDEESASVAELEEFIKRPIRFQVESLYTQEQYDVVLT